MLSTTQKGNVGVFKVCADLATKGLTVLLPQGGEPHYDLVVVIDNKFLKVQVKYSVKKKGVIQVRLFTIGHKGKPNYHFSNQVDLFAIYEPIDDKVYYVSRERIDNKTTLFLRVDDPKNNKTTNVHWAKDYCEIS